MHDSVNATGMVETVDMSKVKTSMPLVGDKVNGKL